MLLEESLSFPRFSNRQFISSVSHGPQPPLVQLQACLHPDGRGSLSVASWPSGSSAIQLLQDFPVCLSKALISYSLIKRLVRALCTPNTQILGTNKKTGAQKSSLASQGLLNEAHSFQSSNQGCPVFLKQKLPTWHFSHIPSLSNSQTPQTVYSPGFSTSGPLLMWYPWPRTSFLSKLCPG